MARGIDQDFSAPPEENESESRMYSDSTQSDHTYCYIMDEPVRRSDREKPAVTLGFKPIPRKGKLNKCHKWSIAGGTAIMILATVTVILVIAVPKRNEHEEIFESKTSTTTTKKPTTLSSTTTQRITTMATVKPQTSSSRSTRRTSTRSTKPPENPVHCMFVGDVLNLGKDAKAAANYMEEKEMIFQIAESVINWYDSNTVASWAYGHIKTTRSFRQQFKEFTHDWLTFADHTAELMKFYNDTPVLPAGGNDAVFTEINETGDDDQRANCLVFLSAMTNAEGYTIKPNYVHYKRIVVVNMAGGDFSKILDDNRGTVVPVSQPYNHEDRKNSNKVFKAIVEGFLNY